MSRFDNFKPLQATKNLSMYHCSSKDARQSTAEGEADSSFMRGDRILQKRRELYPRVYVTDEAVQEAIKKYAVSEEETEIPKRPRFDSSWQPLASTSTEVASDDFVSLKEEQVETTSVAQPKQQLNIYSNADIYGVIPSKDKYLAECRLCKRQVATSRFAPHLDKCMGLGTVRGAVTSGALRGISR